MDDLSHNPDDIGESPDLGDIFPDKESPPPPGPPENLEDHLAAELRKHRIINISFGILTACLLALITGALIHAVKTTTPTAEQNDYSSAPYIPRHSLPPTELWAIKYSEFVPEQSAQEVPPDGPNKIQWIKHTAFHVIMGEQALRSNQLDPARHYLEEALKTFPEMRGIHAPLGFIYLKKENFKKAATHLQLAREEGESADLLNNLGLARMGLKDFGPAEQYLKQALQMDPSTGGYRKNLALLYQQSGRIDEALQQFEAYFTSNPGDPGTLQIYVDLLTEEGLAEDAVAFLEGLATPGSLPVYLLLARTAAKNNDARKAVYALKHTVRLLSPSKTLEEMHHDVFEGIRHERIFEDLAFQLELASVSLSTNIPALDPDGL